MYGDELIEQVREVLATTFDHDIIYDFARAHREARARGTCFQYGLELAGERPDESIIWELDVTKPVAGTPVWSTVQVPTAVAVPA